MLCCFRPRDEDVHMLPTVPSSPAMAQGNKVRPMFMELKGNWQVGPYRLKLAGAVGLG